MPYANKDQVALLRLEAVRQALHKMAERFSLLLQKTGDFSPGAARVAAFEPVEALDRAFVESRRDSETGKLLYMPDPSRVLFGSSPVSSAFRPVDHPPEAPVQIPGPGFGLAGGPAPITTAPLGTRPSSSWGDPDVDQILAMAPAKRVLSSGDSRRDTIRGILVGFAAVLKVRNGWIDFITLEHAEKEIVALLEKKP